MTCREALVAMLGADPSELAGAGGDSAVAIHVRGCVRCAAVAGRLMSDTRLVASALAERDVTARRAPRRVAWRPAGAFAGTVALATIVFAVMVMRRPGDRAPVSVERSTTPVTVAAPPAPVAQPIEKSNPPATAHRRTAAGGHVVVARIPRPASRVPNPASRFPPPDRLEAVPIRAVASAAVTPVATVAVAPSAGQRAAVIRTSNPSVTVVWIY